MRDRAGQFTSSFDAVFTAEGIRVPAGPPQAPRASAIYERAIGTLRRELPDRLLIVNEHHCARCLPSTYCTTTPIGTVPSANSPQRKPTPVHQTG
jgi:hypothetical protein